MEMEIRTSNRFPEISKYLSKCFSVFVARYLCRVTFYQITFARVLNNAKRAGGFGYLLSFFGRIGGEKKIKTGDAQIGQASLNPHVFRKR